MKKMILVSNRLSTTVSKEGDDFSFKQSMGGLATGLVSFLEKDNFRWVGWNGLPEEDFTPEELDHVEKTLLKDYKSVSVPLSAEELNSFYYGFCNNIIWPLFHYFPTYVDYDEGLWNSYKEVNRKYFEHVMEIADEEDFIWVHDYQLMLLPQMLRETLPQAQIGFFLHIPFPSYEIFRLLPWRDEILQGMIGADLIGFHTYDYARHFLSSIQRLLGINHNLGSFALRNRFAKIDVFPMGIDYKKYAGAADQPEIKKEIKRVREIERNKQLILSVDRLDYSKGIPVRLKAFERFLKKYPEYREKVTLIMIVAPSRTKVHQYQELKRELDELVSIINGNYGTIGWTPVQYFFRAFPFNELTAFYNLSDILLVTPLRDGMNLIAKEYVAAKADKKGIVIISETAGAARELGEGLIVNPSDTNQIADTIYQALEMPDEKKIRKNEVMHKRIQRYDVHYWARDFMEKIESVDELRQRYLAKRLTDKHREGLINRYKKSSKRLILLDYDGTLKQYSDDPAEAEPDGELLGLLQKLNNDERNTVIIVSGRDNETLDKWFGAMNVGLIAGHGVWYKKTNQEWRLVEIISNEWKEMIVPLIQLYVDRTPGSSIEEKDYSIVWHYRKAEPELAKVRLSELKDAILSLTSNLNLTLIEGRQVLEVKNSNINKASAASLWLNNENWDFILCIGDDSTDEVLFPIFPDHAYTIKVGIAISDAKYFLGSVERVRELLQTIPE